VFLYIYSLQNKLQSAPKAFGCNNRKPPQAPKKTLLLTLIKKKKQGQK